MLSIYRIFSVFLFLLPLCGFSQPREKIESMKVAFLTKHMELSPAEAQVFWPLYNDFQTRKEALRKQYAGSRLNPSAMEKAADKEIEAGLDAELAFRQKELDLQKDFYRRLREALPVRKIALFLKGEEEFKKVLLNQLKEK